MKPDIKKRMTETKDRILKRANPHSPWPLVHPFANFVPNPVSIPAKAYPNCEV